MLPPPPPHTHTRTHTLSLSLSLSLSYFSGYPHNLKPLLSLSSKPARPQVRMLAAELSLPNLVALAEDAAVKGPWTGSAGQELRDMLQGMSIERVGELLHHPQRSAVSELEVCTLRRLAHSRQRHVCATGARAPSVWHHRIFGCMASGSLCGFVSWISWAPCRLCQCAQHVPELAG